MLESLGENLKESLRKLLKISLVDKKLVEDLASDIRKALIAADVNVELAGKITDHIKRRALEEKPKSGLTHREHVINIVYEEIVKLLGAEEGKVEVKEKPTKILLVGLFGSGKCVHPESLIPLSDGGSLTAKELYEELSIDAKKVSEVGAEVFDISDKNVLIPSFNPHTLKIENKRLTNVWKLKGKELLQVYLDNGNDFSVRVTPEHPFFVLRQGQVQQVRADELTEDDFIAVPRTYSATGLTVDLLPGLERLDFKIKLDNISIKILSPKAIKPIILPRYLNAELSEFLGYVFGDGHLEYKYVQITNEDPEIIERIRALSNMLFGLEPAIKRDKRTRALYDIKISSVTLVNIFNKIFGIPIGKKGKSLAVPKQIFQSDAETVRQFLKAYFDCDSSAAKDHREIELVTESKIAAKGIKLLLLRFGIVSALSKKIINDTPYWRLRITARYAELYADKIGFRVEHKAERAKNYRNIGAGQGCGKQDMLPLGQVLQDTRFALGFSIGEIQERVNSYGRYESKGLISRESLFKLCRLYKETKVGFIAKILASLNKSENIREKFSREIINGAIQQFISYGFVEKHGNALQLTQKGLALLDRNDQIEKLAYLESLADSSVCWLRAAKIEKCAAQEYVYDFTVEDNHSFIADGIIVHNTTTAAKLAKLFKKQGQKVCLVQTDTWRPAAYEQLKQLSEKINVPFYGIKEEKDPIKIIEKFEPDYGRFNVVIFDSAGRDALNKELTDEIKKVRTAVMPHESLLVISGDIGQAAQRQAQAFKDAVGISGVIVTKLDGTAKGGGALSACSATGAKVKFVGVGEHIDDFEDYKPKNFVSRLLGMGDLETLLKKAEESINKEEAEALAKKMLKADFTFDDLMKQMDALQKMGPLSQVISMIPGMGMANMPKELLTVQEGKMKTWKHIIQSMTKQERDNPDLLNPSRIARIAKGAGKPETEVRDLIKQYAQMKKVMKMMGNQKQMQKLQKMMGGKMPGL